MTGRTVVGTGVLMVLVLPFLAGFLLPLVPALFIGAGLPVIWGARILLPYADRKEWLP